MGGGYIVFQTAFMGPDFPVQLSQAGVAATLNSTAIAGKNVRAWDGFRPGFARTVAFPCRIQAAATPCCRSCSTQHALTPREYSSSPAVVSLSLLHSPAPLVSASTHLPLSRPCSAPRAFLPPSKISISVRSSSSPTVCCGACCWVRGQPSRQSRRRLHHLFGHPLLCGAQKPTCSLAMIDLYYSCLPYNASASTILPAHSRAGSEPLDDPSAG